jgi:hypothetical protein
MIGGFYTHFTLNDKFERSAPSLVFALLLFCRLVISYQVNRREAYRKAETSQTSQTSQEKKRAKKDN